MMTIKRCKSTYAEEGHTVTEKQICAGGEWNKVLPMMMMMMMMMIILSYQRGWDTCVPTPKMAVFGVFKAFLFLKYFRNNLGLIWSSFNQ